MKNIVEINGKIDIDSILIDENVVLVEGRLNIKEDEEARIIVQNIKEFSENDSANNSNGRKTKMIIDITELTSNQKERLKGAIKFFSGDKVNMRLSIIEKTQEKPCAAIFLTEETLEQFKEIVGEKNILLK